MRLTLLIVALAAIAVGLVHLRRREIAVRHEVQQVQIRRIYLRREVARQEVEIGRLLAPPSVAHRVATLQKQREQWNRWLAARPVDGPVQD
jgi:hypothetical protein